jgi:hypothetical protein
MRRQDVDDRSFEGQPAFADKRGDDDGGEHLGQRRQSEPGRRGVRHPRGMVRESPGGLEQSLAAARHEAAARQVPVALPGCESGRRFGEEILTHLLIVLSQGSRS